MILPASYSNGFAPRDGMPLYPSLWRGCVGAWAPCIGPTGLTLRDWSGYSGHGVLTNGPTWQTSHGSYSISFDGTDDNVVSLTGKTLSKTPGLSISQWIYRNALTQKGSFFKIGSIAANTGYGLSVGAVANSDSGGDTFNFLFEGVAYASCGVTLEATRWYHIALTITGNTAKAYLNGVLVATNTSYTLLDPANATLYIGGYTVASINRYMTGLSDDIRAYQRVLSDNEIRLLATRRGIAYEMAPRRRSQAQVTVAPLRYNLFSGSIGNTDVIGAS